MKVCKKCGKEFEPKTPRHKMCDDCARDYKNAYQRAYAKKKREEEKIAKGPKHCKICGKVLTSRQVKYCSDDCAKEGTRRLRRKGSYSKEPRKCAGCGKMFVPKTSNQLYCTIDCRMNHYGESELRRRYAEKVQEQKKIERKVSKRKKSTRQRIVDIDRKAKELGLSYGQYVARYGK